MAYSDLKAHGITQETVHNFVVDAGAIYHFEDADKENTNNWTLLGATRDGNSFSVEQDVREMPIDGAKGSVKGARRIVSINPQIVANLIEINTEGFLKALPGASSEDFPSGDPTHDQITRSLQIADTDYLENIALVGSVHGKDQPAIFIVKNALSDENLEISTSEDDEAGLSITFSGHFDPTDLDTEPYEILYPKAEAPIISTTSVLAEGSSDPDLTIELAGDDFDETGSADTANWTFSDVDSNTGLTLSGVIYIDEETVVVELDSSGSSDGTTDAGTIELQAEAAALAGDENSNTLSIDTQ